MSKNVRTVIGIIVGEWVGLNLGVIAWLVFFYLFFMLPKGICFRDIDQGAIPALVTGPLGAVIGAVIGGFVFRWCFGPTAAKQGGAEPYAAPNGRLGTHFGNAEVTDEPHR